MGFHKRDGEVCVSVETNGFITKRSDISDLENRVILKMLLRQLRFDA